MQDRYAGDANDFIKYLVLRHVAGTIEPLRLGVCWYLTDPNKVDASNKQMDGDRIKYLQNPSDWRNSADPQLFDSLYNLVGDGQQVGVTARSVANISSTGIFAPDTLFYADEVPQDSGLRKEWHQQSFEALRPADVVFLDPDNSVSTQCLGAVRGGKWAAPWEARDHFSESRSVGWISHPRQQRRATHHLRTMATLSGIEGLFCSLYQGHCGFHFLLCERHRPIAGALRQLVQQGIKQNWGTWRYCDSEGEAINLDSESTPYADEVCEEPVELADYDTDVWEFRHGTVVNDHAIMWRKHNNWIDPDCRWEIAFSGS